MTIYKKKIFVRTYKNVYKFFRCIHPFIYPLLILSIVLKYKIWALNVFIHKGNLIIVTYFFQTNLLLQQLFIVHVIFVNYSYIKGMKE